MKKRIVLSLVLVGMLAFGLGMGTFAWFTSQATSTNNTFAAGTLWLGEGQPDVSSEADFVIAELQPAEAKSAGDGYTLTNTGSLPMRLSAVAEWEVEKDEDNEYEEDPSLDLYYIKPTVTIDQEEFEAEDFILVEDFEDWLNDVFGRLHEDTDDEGHFLPDDSLVLSFEILLHEDAGNGYQGAVLSLNLVITGNQLNRPVEDQEEEEELTITVVDKDTFGFGQLRSFTGKVVITNQRDEVKDPTGAQVRLQLPSRPVIGAYDETVTLTDDGEFTFSLIHSSRLNDTGTLTVTFGTEVYTETVRLGDY
ncbi:MAG: TasA family protein [Bacillota bacterium]|nr:TasA family protein [Bacillota bacterium]